jgi:hypothetical protein
MVRPTRKSRTMQQLRRELGAMLKLCPWVLAALLLVAVFWQADLAATTGLFQSPPTAGPPTLIPTDTPPSLPTLEATETVTVEATLELTPTATLEPAATETPSPEAAATVVPTATWTAEPAAEEGDSQGRYAEGESDLKFEWGMLLDSLALGVSYIWLCCGAVILVGLPVVFAVLWTASRRRRSLSE